MNQATQARNFLETGRISVLLHQLIHQRAALEQLANQKEALQCPLMNQNVAQVSQSQATSYGGKSPPRLINEKKSHSKLINDQNRGQGTIPDYYEEKLTPSPSFSVVHTVSVQWMQTQIRARD